MKSDAMRRAQDKVAALSNRGLGLVELWREASQVIGTVVPYWSAPCWYTLDPASLLMTSHFNEHVEAMPSEWLSAEYYEDDVNKLNDIARSDEGVSTLHDVTGGDPTGSPRWQENIKYGGDQELICALRTGDGQPWGALGLYREVGRPLFDTTEIGFVRNVSTHLADGARRALLLGEARENADADVTSAPGLLVLTADWDVESMTPGLERRLAELPGGESGSALPPSVIAVASRALRTVGEEPADVAMARILSLAGEWVVLHGVPLGAAPGGRAAVIIEPAGPARIAPLLMSAYGLSEREQEVARLVLQGCSTAEVAAALLISSHTVQDHLKRIFDKTGVRSRRDLVGKVFFAHFEPRVRDNERRAAEGRPLRNDPVG